MYTLIPPNDDGKELAITFESHRVLVHKDRPYICQDDAELVKVARKAPYLFVKELGMTLGAMLAQAETDVRGELASKTPPAETIPARYSCRNCAETFETTTALASHARKMHKQAAGAAKGA